MAVYRLFSRIKSISNVKPAIIHPIFAIEVGKRIIHGNNYNKKPFKPGMIGNIASCSNRSSIPDSKGLEALVYNLTHEQKQKLLTILQNDVKIIKNLNEPLTQVASHSLSAIQPPTSNQLFKVGLHHALPFVGFGFLDNFIMILAGDYIDLTIGTMFGISTMAAAALGNAISDVAGVGSAQFVETLANKLGIPSPNLDQKQMTLHSVVWSINIGRAVGVAIGCILGMVPLLFIPTVVKLGC